MLQNVDAVSNPKREYLKKEEFRKNAMPGIIQIKQRKYEYVSDNRSYH